MKGYTKAEAYAQLWNISVRQVQYLCKNGRIDGAVKFGTTWAIPENTVKPTRTSKYKPGRKIAASRAKKALPKDAMEQIIKGSLTLDLLENRAILQGRDLALRQKEFDILFFLVQHEGEVFCAQVLYEKIWARPMTGDSGAVQTTINRLRKSLAPCEYGIVTERRTGYVFRKL